MRSTTLHARVALGLLTAALVAAGGCLRTHVAHSAADSLPHTAPAVPVVDARIETVHRVQSRETVHLYGHVVPDETRVYRVNVGIEGVVMDLSDATTGSQVKKNQWLATFSGPDARSSIRSYMVAVDTAERLRHIGNDLHDLAYSRLDVQQALGRMRNIGMSDEQLAEVKRTGIEPEDIRLASPASGFILARNLDRGQRFDRGAELYRIADLGRVWIEAEGQDVKAEDVRSGMAADISVPSVGRTVVGRVSSAIVPEFNPATQSMMLRIEADNPGFALRPDMYADVRLVVTRPASILVPREAVLESGLSRRVYVQTGSGSFVSRDVKVGSAVGDRLRVLEGLSDGDRIVVDGRFMVDSESGLRRQSAVQ